MNHPLPSRCHRQVARLFRLDLVSLAGLIAVTSCSAQKAPSVGVVAPTGGSCPQPSANAPSPPEPNPCVTQVCQQGVCTETFPKDVVRCDLPQELLERQLAMGLDGRAAGVCYQGNCIPRTMCSELCAGDLAEALAREVGPVISACRERYPKHNEDYMVCTDQVLGSRAPLRQRAARELAECMMSCGFRSVDLSEADFL